MHFCYCRKHQHSPIAIWSFCGYGKNAMKRSRLLAILAFVLVVLAVPPLVFFIRSPVLIVTDWPFVALYGVNHIKREQAAASFALFRRVKPVVIADEAGPDMLVMALSRASSRPFCVLFPPRHAATATRYHEQFPEIRSIVIGGLSPAADLPSPGGFLYVYRTDRETDLYRAGLFAGILADLRQKMEESSTRRTRMIGGFPSDQTDQAAPVRRTFALWQDHTVTAGQRDLFSRGVREIDPESAVVFARNADEMPVASGLFCVVLAGAGHEYLERHTPIPVILFSWLDPALAPQEVAVIFDDSPWGLVIPAVRMAAKRQAELKLPSKPLIISDNIADNSLFRMLKKSAEKTP